MVPFNATAPMQDLGVDLVGPLALTDAKALTQRCPCGQSLDQHLVFILDILWPLGL